ncbi:MAG: sigma-70 family RNA polymerase sigma factor [Deltaproteobacteria bacterium]|nr:sigma-70 family RNA polymerase sigma factor [Deltaproteobacteria bacterium]
MSEGTAASEADTGWLERFHAGEAAALEDCYREHYEVVDAAVGRLLQGADRETAVHEVFFRLLSKPEFRRSFRGGSLPAWLTTVARNLATDHLRAVERHRSVSLEEASQLPSATAGHFEEAAEARLLVDQFRREVLPEKWEGVFRARFLEQRDQRDAAATLGIARTTLAYQELRIRALLRKFLLRGEAP